MNPKAILMFVVVVGGIWAGLGLYTFKYAKGFSYLSSDPKVCVNCHIMQPQYDSWGKSSHHAVARCVDCHLPDDFIGKWRAKAENGYFHSKAFTLQNFAEPIKITKKNADILQNNCLRCHKETIAEMPAIDHHGNHRACMHCHSTVGHGERGAMGKIDKK